MKYLEDFQKYIFIQMYKIIRRILISILIIINISCFERQEKPLWLINWLDSPSCLPPCWKNIIPGITTIEEAIEISENDNDLQIYKFPYELNKRKWIQWELSNSKDYVGAWTDPGQKTINKIFINVNSDLLVEDVYKKFGDPTSLKITSCKGELFTNYCAVDLIYTNLGLVVELLLKDFGGNNKHKITILPNSRISIIDFIPIGLESYSTILAPSTENLDKLIIKWTGYGDYSGEFYSNENFGDNR